MHSDAYQPGGDCCCRRACASATSPPRRPVDAGGYNGVRHFFDCLMKSGEIGGRQRFNVIADWSGTALLQSPPHVVLSEMKHY